MRTAILLLLTVLLMAPPAVSQPPDDKLVVPGVRIGKWRLQMTIDDLLRMNGPASPVLHYADSIRSRDFWQYSWYSVAFGAQTFDKKKVEVLVAGAGGDLNSVVPYRTDKGVILLKSVRSDILKGYGKPTVALKPDDTHYVLIYDMIGLGFGVFGEGDEGGGVRVIWVFQPGSAKSIWKF